LLQTPPTTTKLRENKTTPQTQTTMNTQYIVACSLFALFATMAKKEERKSHRVVALGFRDFKKY